MARMRSVKPEYWADEDLAKLSRDARLLYIGLWNLADEHGRLRGDPRYIKGQLFPYDDDMTPDEIDELLRSLDEDGKAMRYRSAGGAYVFLPNRSKHQRLEPDKVPSRLPAPPGSSQLESRANGSGPRADESASDADESEPDAKDHALKHVACSREHVAAAAREPSPAETAVIAATDCTLGEAAAVVERVVREKRPRNPVALLRTIAQAGEMDALVAEVRAQVGRQTTAAFVAAARDGPVCEHGEPGGTSLHPETAQPLCPLCRKRRAS